MARAASAAERRRLTPSTPDRVAGLRALADTDLLNAQDATWAWFGRLAALTTRDRDRATRELARLFGEGATPPPLEGFADGLAIATLIQPRADSIGRRLVGAFGPWLGKHFDADRGVGENRVTPGFSVASRLLWPMHRTHPDGRDRAGFAFRTYFDGGVVEPRVPVLVIDYDGVPGNPRNIVPRVRDELVQIVPGAYLGRALWKHRDGSFTVIGYFALREPVGE